MKRLLILIPVIVFLSIALLIVGGNFALNTPPIRATIQDAVQRATAHEARITGRFAVVWSLTPTVGVDDVALLNPPGFSRPDLLTIRHVEASIALLPLLQGRVEIPTLSIVAPDLLLERDATGRANWQTRPPPTTTPSPDPAAPRPRTPTEIHRVQVSEGRLEFHGVPALQIPTLELAPSGGPISGTLLYNGVTLALAGRAGPAAAPLTLSATSPGVAVTLDGSPVPLDATLSVTASNLTDAARLVGRDLPPSGMSPSPPISDPTASPPFRPAPAPQIWQRSYPAYASTTPPLSPEPPASPSTPQPRPRSTTCPSIWSSTPAPPPAPCP